MLVLSALLLAVLGPSLNLASLLPPSSSFITRQDSSNSSSFPSSIDLLEVGIKDLQDFLANGTVTSVQLVEEYMKRIEKVSSISAVPRLALSSFLPSFLSSLPPSCPSPDFLLGGFLLLFNSG